MRGRNFGIWPKGLSRKPRFTLGKSSPENRFDRFSGFFRAYSGIFFGSQESRVPELLRPSRKAPPLPIHGIDPSSRPSSAAPPPHERPPPPLPPPTAPPEPLLLGISPAVSSASTWRAPRAFLTRMHQIDTRLRA